MSGKWLTLAMVVSLTTTLLNAVIFVGQLSTPASARSAAPSASQLMDDDDFVAAMTKLVRKTVRDYCSVGKKDAIDC